MLQVARDWELSYDLSRMPSDRQVPTSEITFQRRRNWLPGVRSPSFWGAFENTSEMTMTELAPDPSVTALTHQAAKSQATQVMDTLSSIIIQYLDAEAPILRASLLEAMSVQTSQLHALLAHMKALEAKA